MTSSQRTRANETGRIALVTGGSRGIGGAIATRLAASGHRVFLTYFQDHDAAEERVESIERAGGSAIALQRNVGDPDEILELVDEVAAAEDRLDVLVSNAASGVFRPIGEFRSKHWNWTVDINARGFLLLVQACLPLLERASRGRIVALSSAGARRTIPLYALVGASKAALEALVRHFAVELAPLGIRVNAVSPGLVETTSIDAFISDDARERVRKQTPVGRLVTPEDVAQVVELLLSPGADMITGQTLSVDGGYGILG